MSRSQSLAIVALVAVTVAGSSAVLASEDKYPACDFQPMVIYSNPELIEKTSAGSSAGGAATTAQAAMADPKYPAAYFTPTVIYPAN